ncbi:SMC family ATPase [Brachybacterium endophyticum]|uniref:Nuclease SbcCD subunit C n=1 Tax=Brachybacterium endophyticum TaxID=2182385 RepID=A0A2U2RKG9_9MICO|nr:SMC family ATPase [Brachybacterium endophyticum]PWH06360.1 SMC family ATPase [Brachybacterium endophyticum]
MKLHHLHLRGIGPFGGDVDIDFTALGASGMFLLEGPTGSGKSTILDAIVFALYGNVAGSSASGERIRSQFASPTTASVIDLAFETGSGIYRVRREPEYARAKKRGSGTTKQQAKALLWRIGSPELLPVVIAEMAEGASGATNEGTAAAGAAEPIATRLDEVGREIQQAVGLTREQFTQTVLLPQNEFARFLRAGSGERQQVLQRVFGTEVFQDVEKQLEEMRKQARREVEAARGTLNRSLARLVEARVIEGEDLATLEGHADALRLEDLDEAAGQHHASAAEASERAAQDREAATASEAAAQAQAEEATATLRRIDRRRELDTLRARLDAGSREIGAARRQLARDEAARPVADLLRRRDEAATRSHSLENALTERTTETRRDHPEIADLLGTEDAPGALAAASDEATGAAGSLEDLLTLEGALGARSEELASRERRITEAAQALARLDEQIDTRPGAKQELTASRDDARTRAAALADARLAERAAEQRLQAARKVEAQQSALETARTTETQTLTAAQLAAETESDLRRRRFAGIAAELAHDLPAGDPCPVCGSTDHPHRATATKDAVDAEQVEAAEKDRKTAESAHSDAAQKRALHESELQTLREQAGDLEVPAATTAVEEARTATRSAAEAQDEVQRLEQAIARHDEDTAALTERRAADALALERERTTAKEASAALDTDRARVAEARGESASIAERRQHHVTRARAATALREALRSATDQAARASELAEETEQARRRADAQLRESTAHGQDGSVTGAVGGDSVAVGTAADAAGPDGDLEGLATDVAVRESVLPDERRRALSRTLEQRAIEESRLADGLAEEGIADAEESDEARESAEAAARAAREQLTAAQQSAREAATLAARASAVAERVGQARTALQGAMREVRGVSERAGVVVRVADLATANSADGRRVPLSTYVLMRRFEDVVAAANARLARFSGTDLELLRDSGARGARKTGLDLLVLDRRTDQARVPETLSGGETFFVSLALALGLADIVTGEAGGVRMETLFIDEGFGSLDPETLEAVVSEIGHLAQHGRTIGIVSHVGDLKSQVSEQIHVRRGSDGRSHATVTA